MGGSAAPRDGPLRRGSHAVAPASSTYNPFETRETPRGKFSAFPTSVTRLFPKPPDPLGFTLYDPSIAPRLPTPNVHEDACLEGQTEHGLSSLPGWKHAREEQRRGRGSSYPHALDPYPAYRK